MATPRSSPRRPQTAKAVRSTSSVLGGNKYSGDKHDGPLPPGWSQRESRSNPGLFYFLTPDGPTWKPPTEMEITAGTKTAQRRKEPKTTIYRKDYIEWGEEVQQFNPGEMTDGRQRNKARTLHPRAKQDAAYFISTHRQEYVPHRPGVPAAPTMKLPHSVKVSPFQGNTTYRTEYVNGGTATRPKSARARTPPKVQHFTHNSTHRTYFVNLHPKRPEIVHPEPKLHFNAGGPVNSTYRQDYVPQIKVSRKSPRFKTEAGWSKGLNKDDGTTYNSLYRRDYVAGSAVVDPALLRESAAIDKAIVERCNAFEEFKDAE